jgi:carbamoyl-phosphate synthase large subunit
MNNILITSSSNKVSLVKRYKKAATYQNDVKIFTGDIAADVPTALFSDAHIILPSDSDPLYDAKLIDICVRHEIKMIVPTRDEELVILSILYDKLNKIGCKVLGPSYDTAVTCIHKDKFIEFCKNSSIPVPKTYDTFDDIVYPVFAKPIIGKSSKNIYKINSSSEFISLENKEQYIIQEYIDWQEYTIDVFTDFDSNVVSAVPRKRLKIVHGESYIAETENNTVIINSVIDLATKLKLVGHSVVQCFYKENSVKFIEVNPRCGGSSNLSFESGADIPAFVVKLLTGQPIQFNLYDFKNTLKTYRYVTDAFINDVPTNKIFCIDIDGTLCTEGMEYEKAQPIQKVIDKINYLYDNNTIILFTARGYHSGVNWKSFTAKQLETWGVKYHQLLMGKPYADYYIDNKAVDVLNWI